MRKEWLLGAALIAGLINAPLGAAVPGDLVTAVVQPMGTSDSAGFDGGVEAGRQTVVAAQGSGVVVRSAITRAQPIMLTGIAAMLDAHFVLDDPIFNGLAISLIFGILVSTLLTLVVIPVLYHIAYRNRLGPILQGAST